MKYIVLVGDGMADRPIKELGGKTPLQAAFTPNMDLLARQGTPGVVHTIPEGMSPGSDVANQSIMGYDPRTLYSGRGPLEAASMGVELQPDDVAYRCNLVTLKYNQDRTRAQMEDYSSGHITSEEAREIMLSLQAEFGSDTVRFHPGISYRHLFIWRGGEHKADCTPPHDILGKEISDYLPIGPGAEFLKKLMHDSVGLLNEHPVNKRRAAEGKNIANSIWFWGQGKKPSMATFKEKYGLSGAMVSAVDLTKGLGVFAGLEILKVPGVTGYLDTNYVGKAEYSLKALETLDFVYIHVEAPDEAGHSGKYKDKVQAIEDFDALVVGTMLRGLKSLGDHRILLLPDHPTPIELRTHSAEPVPFVLYDSRDIKDNAGVSYSEEILRLPSAQVVREGHKLMDQFIAGGRR